MRVREGQFERATDLFYEAAAVPELWPNALQAVADACGATGAVIFPVHAGPAAPIPSPGIEEVVNDLVVEGWGASNPRMRRGLELTLAGMRGLITDTDMFTPEELARDRLYNEFLVPRGFASTAGMVLTRFGSDLVFPIALERRAEAGPFFGDEIAKMNRLIGRLRPAAILALNAGLASARRVADSLSGAGRYILLLGGSGKVIHVPPGIERQIGDALTLHGGLVRCWHHQSDRRLAGAIQRAVAPSPAIDRATRPVALPRQGRRPLMAHVVPLVGAGQEVFMLARAVLIITDPDIGSPIDTAGEALAVMGLTRAEVRLAQRIGAGEDLKIIAEAEGVALETIRARLKAVFLKTGTHRQAELAVLIASLRR